MAHETEWFHGNSVDWEPVVIAAGRLSKYAALILLLLLIVGCAATEPEARICFVQLVGQTEQGLTVIAQQCMTPEAFAESQK